MSVRGKLGENRRSPGIRVRNPLLGNARAGNTAERFGLARSIIWGGLVSVAGVVACAMLLPAFWHYRKSEMIDRDNAAASQL